jgi:hypothetical protein
MNSDLRNRALESELVGKWTCSSDREKCEYSFFPQNEFSCVVTRPGQCSVNVRGYWDIIGQQLRIGTSPTAAEPAEIRGFKRSHFSAQLPGGTVMHFEKIARA